MWAPCSMIASSQLPFSVSIYPHHLDREARTVERVGLLSHQPVRPSEATLTSFNSWEARGHPGEDGPSAFVLQGCWDPRVRANHCLSTSPVC